MMKSLSPRLPWLLARRSSIHERDGVIPSRFLKACAALTAFFA